MARIKQLSPQEAQKIAAGEVVERPANVVKELVENSLDAGSTRIDIYIEDAGKKLIRVVDNGSGMSSEDAYLCFKHHATSKITHVDQLYNLATFGFRGEALSSIAAVSNITLTTKEIDSPVGIQFNLEQLQARNEQSITCNHGTDIAIADLFYNVPARKKFLKSNDTEWRQIQLLFQAFCLDYKSIHFSLYHNNSLVYNCPPVADLSTRISQLYDHTIAAQLIPIQYEYNGIQLEGVISSHTYGRYDRSALFFLVNKRWVKNHILGKALLKGYANVLPPDKYPLACLHITLDHAQVDINIHPRKEEVQFLHPRIVEQTIQTAVKEGLEKHLSAQLKKTVTLQPAQTSPWRSSSVSMQQFSSQPNMAPLESFNPSNIPVSINEMTSFDKLRMNKEINATRNATIHAEPVEAYIKSLKADDEITSQSSLFILRSTECVSKDEFHIIGQLHKTYILIEEKEGLFIVDQHAAHERILYEQFASRFEQVPTIPLLFPTVITITDRELAMLERHHTLFKDNHLIIEQIGSQQIMVQAVPVHLKEINLEELIRQALGWIEEHEQLEERLLYQKVNEKLHAQMACKAAVKAGDILTQTQMQKLLTDLQTVANRFTCPHGRPTGWNISLYEIEKKFKRKV